MVPSKMLHVCSHYRPKTVAPDTCPLLPCLVRTYSLTKDFHVVSSVCSIESKSKFFPVLLQVPDVQWILVGGLCSQDIMVATTTAATVTTADLSMLLTPYTVVGISAAYGHLIW
jgi:hypothetical protein